MDRQEIIHNDFLPCFGTIRYTFIVLGYNSLYFVKYEPSPLKKILKLHRKILHSKLKIEQREPHQISG